MTERSEARVRTTLQPGDIGRITALHGTLYAAEYGWNHTFEAYVGEHLSRFAQRYPNERESIWIAELDESGRDPVGCIAIARADADVAQLRWFVVVPEMRGSGLGRKLLTTAIDFARAAGYGKIVLDTVSDLTAATRLYCAAGFSLAAETRSAGWGSEVTEQRYELVLTTQ